MPIERADLALSEAVRRLDEQRGALDTVQERAGILLTFAAVANFALGQLAFGHPAEVDMPAATVVGGIAAAAAAAMLLSICWPKRFRFHLDPESLLRGSDAWKQVPVEGTREYMVLAMCKLHEENEISLADLFDRIKWSIVLLIINGIAWGYIAYEQGVK